jgi:hypothetical protein
MSDAAERPDQSQQSSPPSPGPQEPGAASHPRPDADAWATAAAEDLAEEKARRRTRQGQPPGSAAEELRKLMETVADRLSGLSGGAGPLIGMAAQGAAQQMLRQVVRQARDAVEPVLERNPDVLDHLAAAGTELLAAYRSAVAAQEGRWTAGPGPAARDSDGDQATYDHAGQDSGTHDHRPTASAPQDRGDRPSPPGHPGNDEGPDRRDDGPGPGEHIDLD